MLARATMIRFLTLRELFPGHQETKKKNYNSKKEDNKEKDQREDERNVIL